MVAEAARVAVAVEMTVTDPELTLAELAEPEAEAAELMEAEPEAEAAELTEAEPEAEAEAEPAPDELATATGWQEVTVTGAWI